MNGPFKFNVGDKVEVIDGYNKGKTGEIKWLELHANKTIASIKTANSRFAEPESNLRFKG